MLPYRDAWIAAGGDPARLAALGLVGKVAPYSDGNDRCLATIHPDFPQIGGIGDWVGANAVREAAEGWLAAQGCKLVRGPIEMCSWFPYRANLGPFEDEPFAYEPTERPDRWQAAGYTMATPGWVAAAVEHDAQIAHAVDRIGSLSASGWTVQALPLDPGEGRASEATYTDAVATMHRIASEAVTDTHGYAPAPVAAVQAHFAPLRKVVDPRLVFLARAPDRTPAGVLFGLPDHLQPQRGWFVVRTLAVLPQYRQSGVGSWLIAAAHQAARRAGYRAGVHVLPSDPARPADLGRRGGRAFRRYALLEKRL